MSENLHLLAKGLSGFSHPLRIKILVLLEREHSPSELFELMPGETLGTISYHVRMLRDYAMVSETRSEPKRGALEHFYERTAFANALMEVLAESIGIPPKPKKKGRPPSGAKQAKRADERERELLIALGVLEAEPEEEAAA